MTTLANSSGTNRLLERAAGNSPETIAELFARHRERLRLMVRLRLDGRVRTGLDSSAVLDLVYRDVCNRIGEYLADPARPFFLWLRTLTGECIQSLHRRHLGEQAWNAGQEVSLYRGALPETNAAALAGQLLGQKGVSTSATQAGLGVTLQDALNSMAAGDREILSLCHFEKLSNDEAAAVLGIDRSAASQQYIRALKRLKEILSGIPGFFENRTGGNRP
jgi:RNA polymerase sigma-70 factor (ECF subfamily)